MTTQSETIIRDRQDRILGGKYYGDKNLTFQSISCGGNTYSATYIDVPNSEITINFEKNTNVLILLFGNMYTEFSTAVGSVRLLIDNVPQVPEFVAIAITATGHYVKELSAGNHTFKLQYKTDYNLEAVFFSGNYTIMNLSEK